MSFSRNKEVIMSEPQPSTSGSKTPPPAKKPKIHLTTREKKNLVNIYNYLEKSSSTYPSKMELYKITSEIMEVSQYVVRDTMKHYLETQEIPQPKERPSNRAIIANLDDFTLSAIRRKVHQLYFDGNLPAIEKIMKAVNEDDSLPTFSYTTMYRVLKKLHLK